MTPTSTPRTDSAPAQARLRLVELVRVNAAVLRQGVALIERLAPEQFQRPPTPAGLPEAARGLFARGAVGAHFRHVLDHYESFFRGLERGGIDYDRRAREREVEARRELACERLEACARRLEELGRSAADGPIETALGGSDEAAGRGRSSLARELGFLASHTVHHYALIAVLVRLWGVVPDDEFGVAPSTLAYERRQRSCAP